MRDLMAAVVRRDFDAVGRGPLHPDFEYHSLFARAEGEVWHGVDGLRRWAEEVDGTWDDFRVEIESIEEVDADTAVLCARLTGRAKASGVPLDNRLGQLWTREDGLIRRVTAYSTLDEARAAAGLGG